MTLAQIRAASFRLVQGRHWEALPWKDALNGTYPLRPTEVEVDAVYEEMLAMAQEAIAAGDEFWMLQMVRNEYDIVRLGIPVSDEQHGLLVRLRRLQRECTGGHGLPFTIDD